jgi:aspartyl-tRNA(Asn)/glutamyl-tRNA(Gln) amidotransferase subunit B
MSATNWEIVIGIETHVQLQTASKIFSNASTTFGAAPNTQASVVDLALPGTLPVMNAEAVNCAIKFGLAVNEGDAKHIARRSIFARKNYFYPDLPKGYQISQFELPVVTGGFVDIQVPSPVRPELVEGQSGLSSTQTKRIRLTRAHLEEDAGKSLHEGLDTQGVSGIDLNRAGTPLLEVVSEPDMRSSSIQEAAAMAVAYAKALHGIVTWIGICDGNMQEGSFRCDANVSVRRVGEPLGTRCEIKNLNSFRFMERAIQYEARRQIELIEDGGKVVQQTRLYDSDRDETRAMRSKEDAMDYRYFPDPDLLPLMINAAEIENIRHKMSIDTREGEKLNIPSEMASWLEGAYGVSKTDAALLTVDEMICSYFRSVVDDGPVIQLTDGSLRFADVKLCVNFVLGEFNRLRNENEDDYLRYSVSPNTAARLIERIYDQTISLKVAKDLFTEFWREDKIKGGMRPPDAVDELIEKRGLKQVSDSSAIEKFVDDVIAANEKSVAEFKAGKEKALQSLVGQVMKASQGKANPAQVNEILRKKLSS